MSRSRREESDYRLVGERLGVDAADVRRIIGSFFGMILSDARCLPLDNHRRIYSREAFEGLVTVRNIPGIGRIGPVYSRYLRWRANESVRYPMVPRGAFNGKLSRGEIEDIAADVLAGRRPSLPGKRRNSELFDRVWLVGRDGRKSARQVIKKKKD